MSARLARHSRDGPTSLPQPWGVLPEFTRPLVCLPTQQPCREHFRGLTATLPLPFFRQSTAKVPALSRRSAPHLRSQARPLHDHGSFCASPRVYKSRWVEILRGRSEERRQRFAIGARGPLREGTDRELGYHLGNREPG
jgi:hypothetical protein